MKTQRKGRLRQLIRCHQILERLASQRIDYDANLLAEELGFTTKTIYRDLRALKEAGVNVEYDHSRKRYLIAQCHLVKTYLEKGGESTWVQETDLGSLCVSLTEASRYLGCPTGRLKALVVSGKLPTAKRGKHLRVAIKDIVRLRHPLSKDSDIENVPQRRVRGARDRGGEGHLPVSSTALGFCVDEDPPIWGD